MKRRVLSKHACFIGFSRVTRPKICLAAILLEMIYCLSPAWAESPAVVDETSAITWPLLPGESIRQLSTLFYPDDPTLQQRFIKQTLALNQEKQPPISADTSISMPATIMIPALKQLSRYATPKRRPARKLMLSTQLDNKELPAISSTMWNRYAVLEKSSDSLRKALDQLHRKLDQLQVQANQLETILRQHLAGENSHAANEAALASANAEVTSNNTRAEQVKLPTSTTSNNIGITHHFADLWHGLQHPASYILAIALCGLFVAFLLFLLGKRNKHALSSFLNSKPIHSLDWSTTRQEPVAMPPPTPKTTPVIAQIATPLEAEAAIKEARILLDSGKPKAAIALLNASITAHPQASIHPWLFLLEIYRDHALKNEFEALAQQLHLTFNVMQPQWDDIDVAMVIADSLEQFPHITQQLAQRWQDGSAKNYLEELLTDNRNGERIGFSPAVLQEIILLQNILQTKGQDNAT